MVQIILVSQKPDTIENWEIAGYLSAHFTSQKLNLDVKIMLQIIPGRKYLYMVFRICSVKWRYIWCLHGFPNKRVCDGKHVYNQTN